MKKEIFVCHISLHLRLEYITLKFQFTVIVFKFLAHGNQFLIRTFSKVNMQIHATRVETNYYIQFNMIGKLVKTVSKSDLHNPCTWN